MANKNTTPTKCPICGEEYSSILGDHVRSDHDESALKGLIYTDKVNGIPDVEIGARYGISFNYLEKVITERAGTNVSLLKPKKIRSCEPPNFKPESTTVWSFKSRGNWATHDGRYRGNWSPYIPRNVILKYSSPGDTILDQFIGGGTTAVEAKLLGRRCIARDINQSSIDLTKLNSSFEIPIKIEQQIDYSEPEFSVGDARALVGIEDESIDLICTHPPYAGIVNYSDNIDGDLSKLPVPDFLNNMRIVADECFRVLKPGRKCAVLIGDGRKNKNVVPIGFNTIIQFLEAGFQLKELVIKRQHNCKTTGFWYTNSIKYDFLLLAHEYLPIFEKPKKPLVKRKSKQSSSSLPFSVKTRRNLRSGEATLETKTVWLDGDIDKLIKKNISRRYNDGYRTFQEVCFDDSNNPNNELNSSLIFIKSPKDEVLINKSSLDEYISSLAALRDKYAKLESTDGAFVVEAKDIRNEDQLIPAGLLVFEELTRRDSLILKEIILVAPSEDKKTLIEPLEIVHRYLFVLTQH